MSGRHQDTASPTMASETPGWSPGAALMRRFVGRLERGRLVVQTPGGRLVLEGAGPGPHGQIDLHRWRGLSRMLLGWDLGFAEGYIAGDWSTPDLVALIRLACVNSGLSTPRSALGLPRVGRLLRHALNRNTRRGSRRNIAAHYDLGNDFYAHWLDPGMTYSSAIYPTPETSLCDAQAAKLDRVLDRLELSGGERVLEIGCGWGGLAERLLERGCTVTGITLSAEQLAFARSRLAEHVASGACDLRLQDYRDVRGTYDRIVSIEMLEAVGEAFWPAYFACLRNLLAPGGIAVLQVITIEDARFLDYRGSPDFIQTYIFPGGMLPTVDIIGEQARRAGLRPAGSELFGQSYAATLAAWRERFQAAWPAIAAQGFDDQFRRLWDFYLAYCQAGFAEAATDVGLYRLMRAD